MRIESYSREKTRPIRKFLAGTLSGWRCFHADLTLLLVWFYAGRGEMIFKNKISLSSV